MDSQRIDQHINASRAVVYRALLDARMVAQWRVPEGMVCEVHSFDARENGSFRVSLTYVAPSATGKTSVNTDTYHGRFVKLLPDELIVEVIEFETTDPSLQGEITITTSLAEAGEGTDLVVEFEGLPPGVSAADNETGTRMSLAKLSALVDAAACS